MLPTPVRHAMPRSNPYPTFALSTLVTLMVSGCSSPSNSTGGVPFYQGPLPNERRIDHAMVEAAVSQRRVLLVFGADWCSDSRAMAARLTHDPKLAPWIDQNFFVAFIDVGLRNGPLWDAPVVQAYGHPFAEHRSPPWSFSNPRAVRSRPGKTTPLKIPTTGTPANSEHYLEDLGAAAVAALRRSAGIGCSSKPAPVKPKGAAFWRGAPATHALLTEVQPLVDSSGIRIP